ncbi:MAG: hypothetical protein JNM36_15675 [Chitinophagales bacterium]|nr:hypothetical protein [Chitinophagales bacterium]
MANTHNLFQEFNTEISVTQSKKNKMTTSKNALRERVRKHFKEEHPEYIPNFYIQGSYKMKTNIRTKDDICDLDDGVYFFREPDVEPTTLQTWIKDAVNGHTTTSPEHRKKCIRSIFSGDYEIDMPVYIKKSEGENYQIAVKNTGWEESDPKEMVDWFNTQKDEKGVLIRIVKFLKAWCDFKRNKMPSGLTMTILASNAKNNISYSENRDDICLRDILKEIRIAISSPNEFKCIVPAVPNDDLFADYDNTRKDNFLTALDNFIADAEKAITEKNYLKASKYWKKHLGNRFKDGEDKDEEDEQQKFSSLFELASQSKPWQNEK